MVSNPFESGLSVQIDSDTSGLESGIGDSIDALGNLRTAVATTGAALATLSGGAIAGSVGAFADFESQMVESQAIMGDLSSNQMAAMESAARRVGRTTTFSASQAAEAFFFLSSAGLDAAESTQVLGDMATFAQAGQMDLAQATDILTDSASALGLEVSEYNSLADVLVKSNTIANATVQEFGEALQISGGRMKKFGIEAEEGASILAVWADQGLKGRRAGTAMNQTLRDLSTSAQNNSQAWQNLGVSVFNANGEMRPMATIVADLEQATAGMSTETRNATLATLGFTDEGMRNIDMLIGNSEQLRQYEADLRNAGGTSQEVANNQLKSLTAQWQLLKGQIADVGIQIGSVFAPALKGLIGQLSGVVQWFSAFNRRTNGMAGAVTLVTSLITGLIMSFGALASSTAVVATAKAALIGAVSALGTVIGGLNLPIVAVIALVGALAAAFATDFAGIRTHTMRVVNALRQSLQPAFQWLAEQGPPLFARVKTAVLDFVNRSEPVIQRIVTAIADGLIAGIQWAAEVIPPVMQRLAARFQTFRSRVSVALNAVRQVIQTFTTVARQIWDRWGRDIVASQRKAMSKIKTEVQAALQPMQQWWARHGDTVIAINRRMKNIVNSIVAVFISKYVSVIKARLSDIRTFWNVWGDDIMAVVSSVFDTISAIIRQAMDATSSLITIYLRLIRGDWRGAWDEIKGLTVRTFNRIQGVAQSWSSTFRGIITTLVNTVTRRFLSLRSQVTSEIESLVSNAIGKIRSFANNAVDAFRDLVSRAASAVSGGASEVVGEFDSMVSNALSEITSMFGQFKDAGSKLVSEFAEGISNNVGKVTSAIQEVGDTVDRNSPSSDAEEGPLSNISDYGPALVDTITDGIYKRTGRLDRAANVVAETMAPVDPSQLIDRPTSTGSGGDNITNINIDKIEASSRAEGREAARAIRNELVSGL